MTMETDRTKQRRGLRKTWWDCICTCSNRMHSLGINGEGKLWQPANQVHLKKIVIKIREVRPRVLVSVTRPICSGLSLHLK